MHASPRRAFGRATLAGSVVLVLAVALHFGAHLSARLSLFGAWNAGALSLLSLAWMIILKGTPASTREHASADDPGRTAIYALVLVTSASSLLSAVALVGRAKAVSGAEGVALVALCLADVALCWALTHTAFTLRYAHLYYREDDEGVGGVEFPGGGAPAYFDFAYFAFTIGMCFQVSDCTVSSPQIRRAVLLHALLAFVYNTAIIAFVLNLVFGFAG